MDPHPEPAGAAGAGKDDAITVYDFLAFFGINQYMPDRKYAANRQAIENLARDEPELVTTAQLLHDRFGSKPTSDANDIAPELLAIIWDGLRARPEATPRC